MSAAACAAKIKLDGGRAIAGAQAFIQQVQDAMDAANVDDMTEFEKLTPDQQKALEKTSQKWCDWGAKNFKWGDDTFNEFSAVLTNGGQPYEDVLGTHTNADGTTHTVIEPQGILPEAGA